MPGGAEYVGGPPQSDNAIEAGENELRGVPKGSDVSLIFALESALGRTGAFIHTIGTPKFRG